MSSYRRLFLLATTASIGFGAAGPVHAQASRVEGADTVFLLVRSDDAGMSHAVNMGTKRLLESGLPVSVSIMFPTPWWQETVELLRAHPNASVGVHLTLNSEWRNYRWGPVVGRAAAPSLVDEDGYFFHSAQDLYDNEPSLAEVEAELRAQIERALGTGLQIDYVDFHMGTARWHAGFLEIVKQLADEYGLVVSGLRHEAFWSPQYRASPADKPDSLAAVAGRLGSGVNVLITHPGLNSPELAALLDMNTANPLESMAAHRQGELDALLSEEFRRALDGSDVRLITYRDLRARPRTFVAIFAHPDDERIVGPLLARYAREGHRVHLVIATDGSKGVREHAGVPAGEALARARAEEAQCAADELGIRPPILLELEDAGLASFASLSRLREEVRRILGEIRPDAIITFGPEGGTGHPDHRLVGIAVTEVVQSGGAGVPSALYYPSLPAERMRSAPAASPQVTTMPAAVLTTAVPFSAEDFEAGRRAFACHATQYTPAEMSAIMSYLEHGFEGAVRLRPWRGGTEPRTEIF